MLGAVTIDGQDMKLTNGWFEDSWTYNCQTGGSVTVLWQLYRPLLGNTVEITTGASPLPAAAWPRHVPAMETEPCHVLGMRSPCNALNTAVGPCRRAEHHGLAGASAQGEHRCQRAALPER